MRPELEPDIADLAPWSETLTDYDRGHLTVYLRLLDADQDGADWRQAARLILRRNAGLDEAEARQCWESHLQRARWMTQTGYRLLLQTRET